MDVQLPHVIVRFVIPPLLFGLVLKRDYAVDYNSLIVNVISLISFLITIVFLGVKYAVELYKQTQIVIV
jgi:hypothetical protein